MSDFIFYTVRKTKKRKKGKKSKDYHSESNLKKKIVFDKERKFRGAIEQSSERIEKNKSGEKKTWKKKKQQTS